MPCNPSWPWIGISAAAAVGAQGAVGPLRAGCWLRGPCRSAGWLSDGSAEEQWFQDDAVERHGLGSPQGEARRCIGRARLLWVLCGNSELEPVTARFGLTGEESRYPAFDDWVSKQWGEMASFAHYQMSFSWKSVNQFSDADIGPPLRDCDFENGVDWAALREELLQIVGLAAGRDGQPRWTEDPIVLTDTCRGRVAKLRERLGEYADPPIGAWAVSDATSDCFLGMLSLMLFDLACSHFEELGKGSGFGEQEHWRGLGLGPAHRRGGFESGAQEVLQQTSFFLPAPVDQVLCCNLG